MNELQEKAVRDHEAARRAVQSQLVGKSGNRAEVEYGEAYQRLVALGLASQIKLNYRTPKRYVSGASRG